ncbi:hypothetical protein BOTBODRAFT_391672 [Botryobasidium botryosum FD-172 SS1]|uniref:CFEM domain-containing protein n=1 Tax=Botryobasidium botryosum (strain FD-172 SS1) TaxID=930990 RepID=A0A067N8Z0_BOTB1|nr:hypothetical protein BOTBODRAFT_391672 [Botryobasidium botryosum FD-172 SS1]
MHAFAQAATLFALALSAAAQTPTTANTTASATIATVPNPLPTAGISPCILNCTTTAAATYGCTSITDQSCVCTNTAFQQANAACINATCPTDLPAALGLQQSVCGAASASGSGSATTHPASHSTSSSGAHPTQSTGAASALTGSMSAVLAAVAFVGGLAALL